MIQKKVNSSGSMLLFVFYQNSFFHKKSCETSDANSQGYFVFFNLILFFQPILVNGLFRTTHCKKF